METFIFILLCLTGGIIIYFKYQSEQRRKKRLRDKLAYQSQILNDAEKNYRKGLSELKLMPTNADLKELVLKLGREYSGLTRQFHGTDGITIYDEIALMNDINAACAGATSITPRAKIETKQTIEHRLEKLLELMGKNLISEQEYNERRQKILDEI